MHNRIQRVENKGPFDFNVGGGLISTVFFVVAKFYRIKYPVRKDVINK